MGSYKKINFENAVKTLPAMISKTHKLKKQIIITKYENETNCYDGNSIYFSGVTS